MHLCFCFHMSIMLNWPFQQLVYMSLFFPIFLQHLFHFYNLPKINLHVFLFFGFITFVIHCSSSPCPPLICNSSMLFFNENILAKQAWKINYSYKRLMYKKKCQYKKWWENLLIDEGAWGNLRKHGEAQRSIGKHKEA